MEKTHVHSEHDTSTFETSLGNLITLANEDPQGYWTTICQKQASQQGYQAEFQRAMCRVQNGSGYLASFYHFIGDTKSRLASLTGL